MAHPWPQTARQQGRHATKASGLHELSAFSIWLSPLGAPSSSLAVLHPCPPNCQAGAWRSQEIPTPSTTSKAKASEPPKLTAFAIWLPPWERQAPAWQFCAQGHPKLPSWSLALPGNTNAVQPPTPNHQRPIPQPLQPVIKTKALLHTSSLLQEGIPPSTFLAACG
ncbi:hypothetical protein ABIE13_002302 [Ottowia thiooxydans]|uniref:Uncharacterized protein n=1 Tax=Ottowia thiooxydans TaxID=219182 RepID=A0ABV2Q826_9BURK